MICTRNSQKDGVQTYQTSLTWIYQEVDLPTNRPFRSFGDNTCKEGSVLGLGSSLNLRNNRMSTKAFEVRSGHSWNTAYEVSGRPKDWYYISDCPSRIMPWEIFRLGILKRVSNNIWEEQGMTRKLSLIKLNSSLKKWNVKLKAGRKGRETRQWDCSEIDSDSDLSSESVSEEHRTADWGYHKQTFSVWASGSVGLCFLRQCFLCRSGFWN